MTVALVFGQLLSSSAVAFFPEAGSFGVQSHGMEQISGGTVYGAVLLDGTEVLGPLVVEGDLSSKGSKIRELTVNGSACLRGTAIEGKARINGFLSTQSCRFEDEVEINGLNALFQGTLIKSLRLYPAPQAQTVRLSRRTRVKGNIVFEGGNGQVIMDDSSNIQGKVLGGRVVPLKDYSESLELFPQGV